MVDPDIQALVKIVADSIARDDVPSDIAKRAMVELATIFLIHQQRLAIAVERAATALEKLGVS